MNIALIVASGTGSRMHLNIPKQFYKIDGKEILYYTLKVFENNKNIDYILVVTSLDYIETVKNIINKYQLKKIKFIVEGGSTRQESVFNGLKYLKEHNVNDNDLVLIHDGVRPLVDDEIIDENIKCALKNESCITAIKSIDSIAYSEDTLTIKNNLNRDNIYLIQTPQTFKFSLIYNAHLASNNDLASDDSSLVRKINHQVYIVKGNKRNIKITTQDDLDLLKYYLLK